MAFREAAPFLTLAACAAVLTAVVSTPLTILPLLVFGYILYFFRDPERTVPKDETLIVSPADGKVVAVDEVVEETFTSKKMKRVGVFLSVFDVHVNRAPSAGRVAGMRYQPGQFLDARNPEADIHNEAMIWLLDTADGPIVVRQIAGLIARRIVAWKGEGDELERGERIGMIRFGSRTDVYIPAEWEVLVKVGDRVQGATSAVARKKPAS